MFCERIFNSNGFREEFITLSIDFVYIKLVGCILKVEYGCHACKCSLLKNISHNLQKCLYLHTKFHILTEYCSHGCTVSLEIGKNDKNVNSECNFGSR